MRRIVIVGNAGSGKSTFARRLGERLQLPVIHLDAIAWEPGWQQVSTEILRSRLTAALSGDAWVTDGNYAVVTFDLRLPRADLLIWVDRPRIQCLWRVIRRAVHSHFRADQNLAAGCTERFDRRFLDRLRFIVNFDRINRPRIETERMRHGPHVPVVVLRGDAAISRFLIGAASGQPYRHEPRRSSDRSCS